MNIDDKILEVVQKTLDDHKAEDIEVMDLRGKTSLASYMVIASGTSSRQVSALSEYVVQELKKIKVKATTEGKANADWVLIDAMDVIVHIFKPEVRAYYNLEKMWKALLEAKPSDDKNKN